MERDPPRAAERAVIGQINWIQVAEMVEGSPPGGASTLWGTSGQAYGSSAVVST